MLSQIIVFDIYFTIVSLSNVCVTVSEPFKNWEKDYIFFCKIQNIILLSLTLNTIMFNNNVFLLVYNFTFFLNIKKKNHVVIK